MVGQEVDEWIAYRYGTIGIANWKKRHTNEKETMAEILVNTANVTKNYRTVYQTLCYTALLLHAYRFINLHQINDRCSLYLYVKRN